MHKKFEVSSWHVTPRQYILDQGSTPQFPHGSETATECFKMSEFTPKHSLLFIFQVEN